VNPIVVEGLRHFFTIVSVAVGALLPIVGPLNNAPMFLAATSGFTPEQRHTLARAVGINSFMLLAGSILVGAYVLDFFGLSVSAVQVGGGLLLGAIAWPLLSGPSAKTALTGRASPALGRDDLGQHAFYPLTMPLTVGPGSISVAITLGANPEQSVRALAVTGLAHLLGVALVAMSVHFCYRHAETVLSKMGPVVTNVVTRLSAFILLCIGVQICWNGVHALLTSTFPDVPR
jgi:multiple antibiotic resistance protein